ncbi:MAG TPA: hypothetical protein DCS93_20835 [Microscillaceae bacterium]|nr:hypothetical protein [Microscillaceae bacterium]
MKQSLTYFKQGLALPFWLAVALLSSLSGYVAYSPTPLRASYRTEIVYVQKSTAEQVQVKVKRQKPPYIPDKQRLRQSVQEWHQHQQQVAFWQTTQQYHSIKVQLQSQLPYLPVRYTGESPLLTFCG